MDNVGVKNLIVSFGIEEIATLKALAQAELKGDRAEYQRLKEAIGDKALYACAISANESRY